MQVILLVSVLSVAAQAAALSRPVAYLPQTEALCGGAAAAMVMRYWGDASIRPEDFTPLVDRAQEGIVTTVLVEDLRRRGWQAFPLRGGDDFAVVVEHLARGRPVIALIEDRPSRYHYVVVTAVDASRVTFHDPAIAPSQEMTRAEFSRRWQAANYWTLLIAPANERAAAPEASGKAAQPSASDAALGKVSAFESEISGLLRSGNVAEALRRSDDATRRDPRNTVAWDALGTSLFVADREVDALAAWNRAGKPDVDTVQIAGLGRTRYRAAESLIALDPGERLTPWRLERARRRLAMLPSASASRVSYAPQPDGRVQIDAAIAERSRFPGLFELAIEGAAAPFTQTSPEPRTPRMA